MQDGIHYRYIRSESGLEFQVRKGDEVRELVADWAFGAGDQAVTFVSRLNEDFYIELRASYYSAGGLMLTPGHQNHHPKELEDALGVRYKIFSPRAEILSCFGCHSTGLPSLGDNQEILPAEPGVRCEACHGPGKEHFNLVSKGNIEAARGAVINPSRLEASASVRLCGECHRPPASEGVAIDWSDAWNVRHQPVYLTESACFKSAPGGMSCVVCHDPHQPLRRNDATYYNAKCISCHDTESRPPAAGCRAQPGCVSCHMPKVRPQPGLIFHNHRIGVYAPADPLRPQR